VTLRRTLTDFVRVVLEEADKNSDFEARLLSVLGALPRETGSAKREKPLAEQQKPMDASFSERSESKRPSNRRPQAVLDPVQIAREGEQPLRAALGQLTLDQLRDIVADYGMDPGKLVMKWRTEKRIIDRIVEISLARSRKGDAFRGQSRESAPDE
jgi:hypothetical protein